MIRAKIVWCGLPHPHRPIFGHLKDRANECFRVVGSWHRVCYPNPACNPPNMTIQSAEMGSIPWMATMIAISTKGMKVTVTEYKGKPQQIITLGLSNGKYPPFNVMHDGKNCQARIFPKLNESTGVWELQMSLIEAEGVKAPEAKPKVEKSFKSSEVTKTITKAEQDEQNLADEKALKEYREFLEFKEMRLRAIEAR